MRWAHLWVVWLLVALGLLFTLSPLWDAIGLVSGLAGPVVFGLSALLLWPFYRDRVAAPFWRFAAWVAVGVAVGLVVGVALLQLTA